METWKPVTGFEEAYAVSDKGRVKSLSRIVVRKNGIKMPIKERMLKPWINDSGYPCVDLHYGGKRRMARIYWLVGEEFVSGKAPGLELCHNDSDKLNSNAENLRWDTRKSNIADLVATVGHYNANKTHCKWGHEFSTENTYKQTNGGRGCKVCKRERSKAWRLTAKK